ncbi:radical SAM protein [Deinococcus lacus]|uniref:Radical SAM protein n=1 Tax=Deinococcus lacus TaxID=392561 RepID=A0ABW1YFL4_9DEIO
MTLPHHLAAGPYQSYTYGYPHKTAYRPLTSPLSLKDVWEGENKSSLFLYLHIPFCEMRCGFCNLFTTVGAPQSLEQAYLDALERQARVVREALGEVGVARLALGGGTPTYLEPDALERVFDLLAREFGARPAQLPTSVETSPATATPERLRVLAQRGSAA